MIIFDIEASGLSDDSYPIEAAWQDSDDPDCFDSFLVNPSESWKHWDDYAEQEIHHISRNTLYKKGVSISEACERLNTKLAGKTIFSDAFEYDQRWPLKLLDEAGRHRRFQLDQSIALLMKNRYENLKARLRTNLSLFEN